MKHLQAIPPCPCFSRLCCCSGLTAEVKEWSWMSNQPDEFACSVREGWLPLTNTWSRFTWPAWMSAERSVSDDSIRELRHVPLPIITPSLLVCREVYSLCLFWVLWMIQDLLVSTVLISSVEIRISVAAVSSEIELTGRSHSDNNSPLSVSLPLVLPHIPFSYKLFFDSVSVLPLATSYFLIFYLCTCLWPGSCLSLMYFRIFQVGVSKRTIWTSILRLYLHCSTVLDLKLQHFSFTPLPLPHMLISPDIFSLPPCLSHFIP